MKNFILNITTYLFIVQVSLFADTVVTQTSTINYYAYPDKDIDELKELLLKKAKLQAAHKIYGEVLLSYTSIDDGKIEDEHIDSISGGIVHILDDPKFKNGKNLGDLEVTIKAYATEQDKKRYYNKTSAEDIFDTTIKPKHLYKKGFYGKWSGYTMYNNGGSTKVNISISTTGQSKILFSALGCGGDLLIEHKDIRDVKFKKLLNFGMDRCLDKTKIVLIKKGENTIEYYEYIDDSTNISHGVLYREYK